MIEPMKIVFIKYRDPMLWTIPDTKLYDEDLKSLDLMIVRDAGILISEDDEKIVLAEVHLQEDNKGLDEWGVRFPFYRHVAVINKSDIIYRQEWEVSEICEDTDKENIK